jgi:hypothetical protein
LWRFDFGPHRTAPHRTTPLCGRGRGRGCGGLCPSGGLLRRDKVLRAAVRCSATRMDGSKSNRFAGSRRRTLFWRRSPPSAKRLDFVPAFNYVIRIHVRVHVRVHVRKAVWCGVVHSTMSKQCGVPADVLAKDIRICLYFVSAFFL